MTTINNELSKTQRRNLSTLSNTLSTLADINPHFTVGMIRVFLTVAQNPGLIGAEIVQRTGYPLSTVSRYLLDLSVKTRRKTSDSLKLVEARPDPEDLRVKHYFLTKAGQELAETLSNHRTSPTEEEE